ncbi:hypothetical protein NT6N_07230 [Oceaniferula spumae]|uniref:Secreted protein n=1 Tax=Oceaniferula spumae TaxID=2979115 RepID=A0AAT9FI87_9BACT
MSFHSSIIKAATAIVLLATIGTASADPPTKPRLMQYSNLWTNSPFTIKPVVEPTTVESPLERDWMLGSIRPSGKGYSVTLISKKDRKERVRFLPGFTTGDWQLIQVQQDVKDNEKSRVQIRKGSQTAWISYDEKLIKIRPTAAAKPTGKTNPQVSSKSGARPPIPGRSSSSSSSNTPRVRSVPRRK